MTFCSWAKTALWSATTSNVIGTRGTVGVGVVVGLAVGTGTGVIPGPTAPPTGVAIGDSSGSRSAASPGAFGEELLAGAVIIQRYVRLLGESLAQIRERGAPWVHEDRVRRRAIRNGPGKHPVDLCDDSVEQVTGTESVGRDGTDTDEGDHQPEGGDEEQATVETSFGGAGHGGRLTCDW